MQTVTAMRRGPHAQRHRRISRWAVSRKNAVSRTKGSRIPRQHRQVTTSRPVSEANNDWPVEEDRTAGVGPRASRAFDRNFSNIEGGFRVGSKKPLGLKWASQDALRDDLSNEAGPT